MLLRYTACADRSIESRLDEIQNKIEAGRRLSFEEGVFLFQPDVSLHAVGQLASAACRRRHGDVVYYNLNTHINPTNICVHRCKLCAFYRSPGEPDAYIMSLEDILKRAAEAERAGCTELHIVGGLPPDKPFDWYRGLIEAIHRHHPRLHLKAWTAVEIAWFVQVSGLAVEDVLLRLIEAGLGSLPGGGAEIFHPDIRQRISPRKADGDTWLNIHRTAHRLGLKSNATMLIGHVEEIQHRVDHLLRLRSLQDETGGFQAFIPLPFHPARTAFRHLPGPSAFDCLRTIAVSRLLLDNFDHVKAYWVALGIGLAQAALDYGANDLDGTVRYENIYHDAGADCPEALGVEELCGLIREAGREPIERDSLYRRVRRVGLRWEVGM
ncbi:MAG: aminofutalosine synthase MqnE [Thermogutta sp.]